MDRPGAKQCRICRVTQPADQYTGTRNVCLGCRRQAWRERQRRIAASAEGRAKITASVLAYKRRHPHKNAMRSAKRRARQRVPPWSSAKLMADYYLMARQLTEMTGERYHVDHIIPINSPIVCGLHAHTNLRVVKASVNTAKGNRHWPDMP